MQHCLAVFPSVDYAFTTIPTYPSGQIGFLMCSTSPVWNRAGPSNSNR